jgi:hypothetical protein
MPQQQTQTPVRTPTEKPVVQPAPRLWPSEICPQQKREMASPDVSP